MNLWTSAAISLTFFLIGFITAPKSEDINTTHSIETETGSMNMLLQRQKRARNKFQAQIQALQRSCPTGRSLILAPEGISPVGANQNEEFARAFQYLALSFQVAVATERNLSPEEQWTLISLEGDNGQDCRSWSENLPTGSVAALRSIACLQPALQPTPCNMNTKPQPIQNTASYGIVPGVPIDKQNALFHADFYGTSNESIQMPTWPYPKDAFLIDIVPQWERIYGRFWIRSQVSHYVWEEWQQPQEQPATQRKPFIAFYYSNCPKLRQNLVHKYGRNPDATQSIERYMNFAERIRESCKSKLDTIYVVTDQDGITVPPKYGWAIVHFESDEMLSKLEMLRQADFLVGSFQSQFYRVAVQLNAAYFAGHYPISQRRHWSVDVEWFENP